MGKRRITLIMGPANREPSGKIGKVGIRDNLYLPCGVEAEVFGLTFYQGLPGPLPQHLIPEADRAPLEGMQEGPYLDYLIIAGGLAILTPGLGNYDIVARRLEIAVVESPLAAKFRAAHLKPDEVIGVVDHPHGIGLCVADLHINLHTIVTAHPSTRHLISSH
jgi:hypothetical protein